MTSSQLEQLVRRKCERILSVLEETSVTRKGWTARIESSQRDGDWFVLNRPPGAEIDTFPYEAFEEALQQELDKRASQNRRKLAAWAQSPTKSDLGEDFSARRPRHRT
jgi:hypothetical protein